MNRLILLIFPLLIFSCSSSSTEELNSITVEEVKKIIDADSEEYLLLDVRTLEEYYGDLGHLPDAKLIPYNEIANRIDELSEQKDKKIIAYCRSGRRSAIATKILKENGFEVYNMIGGMKKLKEVYPNY
ncbi:MAG: rhodanese-like domain-containing protein [Candidatus Marinimicrobia bacterium]|nr:rhodanese-like domain-containing protein [Candidatus Neomarinimicrobiota bacterium]TFB10959.1 rhodanese-like domain-containing protein [Candidatus Marinimicrobia bacterium MT.SAG.2]